MKHPFWSNAVILAVSRKAGLKCRPHSCADWVIKCGLRRIFRLLQVSTPKPIPKPGFYGVTEPKVKPNSKFHSLPILISPYSNLALMGVDQGRSQKWLSKEGVLRVQKHCRYSPDRRFVRFLVKMTKTLGQWQGFWPPDPPLGYTPGHGQEILWKTWQHPSSIIE